MVGLGGQSITPRQSFKIVFFHLPHIGLHTGDTEIHLYFILSYILYEHFDTRGENPPICLTQQYPVETYNRKASHTLHRGNSVADSANKSFLLPEGRQTKAT